MQSTPNWQTLTVLLSLALAGCAPAQPAGPASSGAEWSERAGAVPELVRAADVVVLAEALAAPVAREVSQALPQMNADGTPVAVVVDRMLFSDTVFAVREVLSGAAPAEITVMQTGGVAPETGAVEGPLDDPLFQAGEVVVLFLVDISDDPIQAPGRALYRAVNPAGRFRVEGQSVRSFTLDPDLGAAQPATLGALLAEIRQAAR